MTQPKQEAPTPTQVIALQVRAARKRRKWSAKQVADRCAEVGMDSLDRTTIANIETGRRQRIGVDEMLVLAYVLAVPPLDLLVPLSGADEVAVTPTVTLPTAAALKWIEGHEPPMDSDRRAHDVKAWREGSLPLALHREVNTVRDNVTKTRDAVRSAEARADYTGIGDQEAYGQLARRKEAHVSALIKLAEVLTKMVDQEVSPPPIAREHLDAIRQLGMTVPDEVRVSEDVYGDRPGRTSRGPAR
jgi:transcriptional regulator with XRE-family HTH domain